MKRNYVSFLFGLLVLQSVATHAADGPRVIQRKSHTMHRPSAGGNLNPISWQHLTLNDDGTQLAAVGTQRDAQQGLFGGSTLHQNGSVIAVWTLKTGKTLRADRSEHVLDAVAFAPNNKSLVGWGARYEFVPSNGISTFSPIAYWDFAKPNIQTLHVALGKPESVLACGFADTGKSLSLIVASPRVTQSLAYKFEPPKLKPRPKVETVLLPTSSSELPRSTTRDWLEPVVFSRNGTTLAVNTGRNVQVLDAAQGTVISTCEARLGNSELRLPLAISKDGSRIAFAVQPAAENEPTSIVVADAKSGQTIVTCQGQKSAVVRLVTTPDGARVSAVGVDKNAHVWEAATGRELATVTNLPDGITALALTPDGSQLVTAAGGDIDVWTISDPASKENKSVTPAATTEIAKLTAPVLPPLSIPRQEFNPTDFTKPEESLYLTFAARRLLDHAVTLAEFPADSAEVQSLISECAAKREHARAMGAEASTVEAFDNIPRLWKTLSDEATKRNQALRENAKLMRDVAAAEKANENSMQLGWFVGLMTMVVGELPMYSNQYDPISRTTKTSETGVLSPAMSEFGMNTAINSLFVGITLQQQLAEAEGIGNEVLRRVTSNSLQRQATAISAARQSLDAALAKHLGASLIELPNEDPRKVRKSAKDYQAVLTATQDRAVQLRKLLNRDEPFAAANVIAVKSLTSVPPTQRATEWFTLASEMMLLTQQVPPGAVYDKDRAALLGMATDLGLRAIVIERGTKSWEKSDNKKALVLLSWLEAALRFDPQDRTGMLREQKAWALCEYGRMRDGYLLAQEIKPIRGHSPRFRIQLARAAHCVGRSNEALEEVAIAIERLGLADLKTVRTSPDLPKGEARFKELTTIQLEVVSETALRGGKARIVNRSSFPLSNARFEMTFPAGRSTATTKLYVAFLPPGEECRIPYNDNYTPNLGGVSKGPENRGTVKLISSDQGALTVAVK